MAKTTLDMIQDILGWPIADREKLSHISHIVGEAPTPAGEKPAAEKKAVKKAHRKKSSRNIPRKAVLWNELKDKAPAKIASLSYVKAKTDELEKLLAEAR